MCNNKVIIAAAGAGKTTFLVEKAFLQKSNVLITTFTLENEAEIVSKFIEKYSCIPKHITIMTWFKFLLQHGVNPYQGLCNSKMFDYEIKGLILVEEQSGIKKKIQKNGKLISIPYGENDDFIKHYFSSDSKIYSDKLAKFVIRANEKSNGKVINRISDIFPNIYVDEVQDLAGYDLEIIKLFFHCKSNVLCVGDPRQVTYYTHWEQKNRSYRHGRIIEYINKECYKKDKIIIDQETLKLSHRNNKQICDFSNLLYKTQSPTAPCQCVNCHNDSIEHQGIFIVKEENLDAYLRKFNPIQLRHDSKIKINDNYSFCNFGKSKGKTYQRVLIYPTKDICKWLIDVNENLKEETRAKLYVAITRAKLSVAFVVSNEIYTKINHIDKWSDN